MKESNKRGCSDVIFMLVIFGALAIWLYSLAGAK